MDSDVGDTAVGVGDRLPRGPRLMERLEINQKRDVHRMALRDKPKGIEERHDWWAQREAPMRCCSDNPNHDLYIQHLYVILYAILPHVLQLLVHIPC